MPDGPRPADVQFDDAAADAAVEALGAALGVLAETEPIRSRSTTQAAAQWQGGYADDFDEASGGLDDEADAAREAMQSLARAISGAQDDAAARRREVRRAQAAWDTEAEFERQHPNLPR